MNMYDSNFPVVTEGLRKAGEIAEKTGEMRTVLRRRRQYNLYEPVRGKNKIALPFDQAVQRYGTKLRRAKTYKALNVYTQGSSADIMKKAMVLAFEEGLYAEDKLGPPHLTVHDELDNSYHPDLRLYFLRHKEIMEHAVNIHIPLIVENDLGPSWGNVQKHFNLETGDFDD